MASLSFLPALKAGTLVAGTVIAFSVCGLRPLRSARFLTSKVPKPIKILYYVFYCAIANAYAFVHI